MKTKIIIFVIVCVIVLAVLFAYNAITSSASLKNNVEGFRSNITSVSKDVPIALNELTPFEWEEVYFFDPYVSKEEVYNTIGFRWNRVKQQVSEGMMQILFVNKGKVVCYLNGYSSDNGYYIDGNITVGNSQKLEKVNNPIFVFDSDLSQRLGYICLKYLGRD